MNQENNIETTKPLINGGSTYKAKQEFDGLYLISLLYKNKRFILIFTFICAVASVIYAVLQPNWYLATTNVVPPKSNESMMESAMSSISSALKDFGLNKIGGGQTEGYSFLVILESRSVKDSIINKYELDKEYDIPKSKMTDLRAAFEDNLDITYETEGNYTISIWDKDPRKAALMANDYVRIANNHAISIFREEAKVNLEYIEKRFAATDSVLISLGIALENFSRSKQIFSAEDQAKSLSEALVELKLQEQKYDMAYDLYKNMYGEEDVKTQTYKELLSKTSSQLDKIQNTKGFAGNFSLNEASKVGIDYIRLYAEYETFNKLKAFLLPVLEKTRLDSRKNLENLFVVDKAIAPEKKDKPKRSLIVAGTSLGSFIMAVLFVLLFNGYKSFRKKYREIYVNMNN